MKRDFLLDTDTLIYWLKGDKHVEAKAMTMGLETLSYSIITQAELYFGAYNSSYLERNRANIQRLMNTLKILPFDEAAANRFGQLKADLKRQGKILLDADLMIAAIALTNQLVLVTNNVKHFERIPELVIENWVA
jgi:tRNA(fMet)-specific endonuclease VapC